MRLENYIQDCLDRDSSCDMGLRAGQGVSHGERVELGGPFCSAGERW